jgi:hypothetical protein
MHSLNQDGFISSGFVKVTLKDVQDKVEYNIYFGHLDGVPSQSMPGLHEG